MQTITTEAETNNYKKSIHPKQVKKQPSSQTS